MKNKIKWVVKILLIGTVILSFQACSLKVPLKSVSESETEYEVNVKENTLQEITFLDARDKDPKVVGGIFKNILHLEYQGKELEEFTFIKEALQKEFNSRKLPIKVVDVSSESLSLEEFNFFTHRSSAFSPLVTISSLKVSVKMKNKKKTFTSIVKRGKIPIWTIDEVFDPCFNEPLSILIKETVAKINKEFFGYKFSDKKVSELISKIEEGITSKNKLNYLNVYELGFSNNQKALETLKSYTTNDDEYLRLTSLSMLGLLGGESEFDYLVSKYRNSKVWQDRALSMKAIGDINTEKAKKFLQNEYKIWVLQESKEATWNKMLLKILVR